MSYDFKLHRVLFMVTFADHPRTAMDYLHNFMDLPMSASLCDRTMGCCAGVRNKIGIWIKDPMNTETIIHEALHAAFRVVQFQHKEVAKFEELTATICGQIGAEIFKLRDKHLESLR